MTDAGAAKKIAKLRSGLRRHEHLYRGFGSMDEAPHIDNAPDDLERY